MIDEIEALLAAVEDVGREPACGRCGNTEAEVRMYDTAKRLRRKLRGPKVRGVNSCPECPLALTGEEWHPVCLGRSKPRPLPKNHEPDGPPPPWCPLPVLLVRGVPS